MRTIARRLPLLLPASLCAALLLPAAASATATPQEQHQATEGGVAYLRAAQQSDGSFPGFGGEWALSALSAAGVAPAGVHSGATDARAYYRGLIGDAASWPGGSNPPVTDYENATLAAYASGIDPARVSTTQNLIAQILARYRPDAPGYYGEPGLFNGTAFALLALAETKTTKGAQRVPQALLDTSLAVARANQHTDGGWRFFRAAGNKEALEAPAEAEFTGATIAAMCSAGVGSGDPAIVAAREFLHAALAEEPSQSGAFATEFGPNTDTNAWVVQGLDACGISPQGPEFTTGTGKTPIDYLISQQLPEGGFRFEGSESTANLYSTQDALRALAGGGFTAPPPKAKGAPRWVFEKQFSTSPEVHAIVGLVLDPGSGPLKACAVTVTPQAIKTTLGAVLTAAAGGASSPAGCVGTFSSAKGKITAIDGQPSPAEPRWQLSVDGGTGKAARLSSPIHLGDTVALKLG